MERRQSNLVGAIGIPSHMSKNFPLRGRKRSSMEIVVWTKDTGNAYAVEVYKWGLPDFVPATVIPVTLPSGEYADGRHGAVYRRLDGRRARFWVLRHRFPDLKQPSSFPSDFMERPCLDAENESFGRTGPQ